MQYAYRSFNEVVLAAWAVIVPGQDVLFDSPDDADTLPPDCLRVFWQEYELETRQANLKEAIIDIAVRVSPVGVKPRLALALERGSQLDQKLGIRDPNDGTPGGGGYGRLGRMDWSVTPARYLTDMEVYPDGGWVTIPTNSPGQLHLARTVRLSYRV